MLISAVEWNGKLLLPFAGEDQGQPATFRLAEYSRSRTDGLLNLPANQSEIPNDDRLLLVGAYTAATLSSLLPWLADGSIQPIAERLRTIRYLQKDLPVL